MTDPTRPPGAECGCCAGLDPETPRRIRNRPGQPAVAYRAGTHASFKRSLLARLSSSAYPALQALGTREDDDLTIALCDALATTLDVLTFYQERLANEHYLRTATERRSVLEMARLIGYAPAPGVAASTHLAFTLQETPGAPGEAPAPVVIPAGTRVQSVPAQDEKPQTFETVEPVEARVAWNAIPVQATVPWRPAFGDTDLWVEGVATGLAPGDAILIVGAHRVANPGSERWDVRVLDTVEPDTDRGRTRLGWRDGLGSVWPPMVPAAEAVRVFALRRRAALFGHNAPDPNLMSVGDSNLGALIDRPHGGPWSWKGFEIGTAHLDLDAVHPGVTAGSWIALVSNEPGVGSESLPGYVELYRAQRVSEVTRSDFGLSAKVTRVVPDTTENLTPDRFTLRDTLVLAHSEELAPARRALAHPLYGDRIALEGRAEGLRPGQALAVSGRRQRLAVRPGVTSLSLLLEGGATRALDEGDKLTMVAAPVRLDETAPGYVRPEELAALMAADSRAPLRWRVEDRDGRTGRVEASPAELALAPGRDDDPVAAEIALVGTAARAVAHDRDRTTLELAAPLARCYERATARVGANVARATHGETVEEVLGGGDASVPDQAFALRQSPLTFVSADTASGRASSLEVRVNDLRWTEVPSLHDQPPDARVHAIEIADDGTATVRFGDGVEGARPPSGETNVRATYRKGVGTGGNVAAGALTTLLARPLGVSAATNPDPATGGEDPETLDQARRNAPLGVLTLDRAVSVSDYADFARAFTGIDKAHALWIPAGPARGVLITIAGVDGAPVPETSDTFRHLRSSLARHGDPLVPVRIVPYRPATFRTRLAVKVAPGHDREPVLAALRLALRTAFGFHRREFGQGVSRDEIAAVAHGVDGVEAVHVVRLYRAGPGIAPGRAQRLAAELPVADLHAVPRAAELLTLADASPALEPLA